MSDIVQTYYVYTIVGGIIGTTTIQIDSETLKSKLFEHSIKGEYKHCYQNIIFKLTKEKSLMHGNIVVHQGCYLIYL